MTGRQRFLLLLTMGHMSLAIIGAAYLSLQSLPVIGGLLHSYSALSGAGSRFGFFAPNVGGNLRATFDLVGPGDQQTSAALNGSSHESDLRIGNTVGILWEKISDEKVRRSMAASWTAHILSKHPGVTKAVAKIEAYDLPTMENYRRGDRPLWRSFYTATFTLGAAR